MMWTVETWDAFVALLEGWWPGEFSDASADAWRLALDGVEPPAAVAALRGLLLSGRRFRPSASEMVAELRRDVSCPTFDEAWAQVYGRGGLVRAALTGGSVGEVHPLVASFVDVQTVERLSMLPVDDPEWGFKHRRDLEAAWDRHCEARDGREIAVLARGDGLRRLGVGIVGELGA